MSVEVPPNFQRFLEQNTKNLAIVVRIDGVDDVLSSTGIGTRVRYGDGTLYGDTVDGEPIRYGGLRPYQNAAGGTAKQLLDLNSSNLTLSQVVEQEQGRASISQMSLGFLDNDGYMTRLITPGLVVDEIIGRDVSVYIGFTQISFPEDYWRVFRGRIQGVRVVAKVVTLQLGDPNLRRRKTLFYQGKTTLASPITNVGTIVPVTSNGDFHRRILGPDGLDDSTARTFIKIEDEFIEYNRQAFGSNTFTTALPGGVVTRGARSTTAVAHSAGADVFAYVELSGNPIDMALKSMLSGWNGPYETGLAIYSFVFTGDPDIGDVAGSISVPDEVDAVLDLGLSIGDYITVSGDGIPGNNITAQVTGFQARFGLPNRIIETDGAFTYETTPTGTMALRSQYDSWPTTCGLKLYPWEVDVESHVYVRDIFLAAEQMRILIRNTERSGKDFIEREFYLPVGAYSLTRFGTMGVKLALPPIADDRLLILDADNVVDPANISIERSTTNRNFFNEVTYDYDEDDNGSFRRRFRFVSADSISAFELVSVLPITTRGTKSDLTSESVIEGRAKRFIGRYQSCAILLKLKVLFGIGATIENGDILILEDPDTLKIPNFETGSTSLGTLLLEVKERTFDLKTASVNLTLLGGLGFNTQDKFATFAPSSKASATGSSASVIRITPSFGAKFGINEWKKWKDYVGVRLRVHNDSFSVDEETVLTAIGIGNPNNLTVDPPLSFIPNSTHTVDLALYSTSSDENVDAIVKLIHAYFGRTVPIVSGISTTQFTVGAGDAQFFRVGYPLIVRDGDYAPYFETVIVDVTGVTITVEEMPFTPTSAFKAELVSWYDARPGYRFI